MYLVFNGKSEPLFAYSDVGISNNIDIVTVLNLIDSDIYQNKARVPCLIF